MLVKSDGLGHPLQGKAGDLRAGSLYSFFLPEVRSFLQVRQVTSCELTRLLSLRSFLDQFAYLYSHSPLCCNEQHSDAPHTGFVCGDLPLNFGVHHYVHRCWCCVGVALEVSAVLVPHVPDLRVGNYNQSTGSTAMSPVSALTSSAPVLHQSDGSLGGWPAGE